MLTIRLRRKGKKNQPFFRVIVIDKRKTAKGGNAVEILGSINPLTKKRHFEKDRILYWISKGAKPSATVHNMLVTEKIIDGKKINVARISKKKQKEIEAGAKAKADEEAKTAPTSAPEDYAEVKEEKSVEPMLVETPTEKKEESKPEEKPTEKPTEALKEGTEA